MSAAANSSSQGRAPARIAVVAALAFLLTFILGNVVASILSTGSLPRPDASDREVYDYFAANAGPSVTSGVFQVAGAVALGFFVSLVAGRFLATRLSDSPGATARGRVELVLGWFSAAVYALCGVVSVVLGLIAADSSVSTVNFVRDLNFYSGGVAHVVTLGVFVILLSRRPNVRGVLRVSGMVAGALATASIASVVVYPANALLPLGRVTCMLWCISAAISLILVRRRQSRPDSEPDVAK